MVKRQGSPSPLHPGTEPIRPPPGSKAGQARCIRARNPPDHAHALLAAARGGLQGEAGIRRHRVQHVKVELSHGLHGTPAARRCGQGATGVWLHTVCQAWQHLSRLQDACAACSWRPQQRRGAAHRLAHQLALQCHVFVPAAGSQQGCDGRHVMPVQGIVQPAGREHMGGGQLGLGQSRAAVAQRPAGAREQQTPRADPLPGFPSPAAV